MQPNQPLKNNIRQAVMLDLSLFVLDLLDPQKIQLKARDRDHLLEVPSALVLMLRDSRIGDPTLFLFIYSLLVKTIGKYKEKHILNQRITQLIDSPDLVVRRAAWGIAQRLFDEFSSLINIAPRPTLPENLSDQALESRKENTDFPIRRYDAIGSFSQEDQKSLQRIYTAELNLPVHPLYDLYFSQIYHAQTVGLTQESSFRRQTIALDDETFKIVSEWKGKTSLAEESNVIQATRNFLRWFITTYLKNEWQGVALDASLELSVAGVLTGSFTGSLPVTLITLTGGTILKAVVEAPPDVLDDKYKLIVFSAFFLLIICCALLLIRPNWFVRSNTPSISINLSSSSPPTPIPSSPDPTSTITIPATQTMPSTSSDAPVLATPISTDSITTINSPNFCLYVIQPNDTIQSIASWFFVTENDIRNSSGLVSQEIPPLHKLIKVNASCCTHIGVNNGFSYTVQPNDNVFRLAINFTTALEKIVLANNLGDSRYIQSGQMLCIPYP